MNKHFREAPIDRWEPHFVGLITPTISLSEGILEGFSGLRRAATKVIENWKRQRKVAATVTQLSRLDDHTLRDIGLHRSEIYAAALAVVADPDGEYHRSAGD